MELLDIILKRRSIREYTEDDISDEKVDKILMAGLLAPTSRNRKPCEFIVVKDKNMLESLSHSKSAGSAMLENANCAIVTIADSDKADTWIEDSSIAMAYMDLMATNMDVASCWVQSHLRRTSEDTDSEEYIRKLFDLDDKYRIVGILSLGLNDNRPPAHRLDEIDRSKIRYV
ncbi:MAG: nitroreductase family protein [Methanosphaera sp.]|nr:nitroreductase family protein [Methanosphaera sp.]